jgi:hypothetical protein
MKQNSIEIVTVLFNAGESRLFALSGEYFEVIEAPNPIDVLLSDFNGAQRARMNQAAASFYSKGVSYGVIQITSASAQTIRFAYGTGETGTRRSTGAVTVSGPVALDAATLAALEITNVRPEGSTGFWSDASATVANTPIVVFTPASNTNGVVLMSAAATNQCNSGLAVEAFIHKTSAPVSLSDGSIVLQSVMHAIVPSCVISSQLPKDQLIPAGHGLYFISNIGNAAGNNIFRSARWRNL